MEVHVTNFAQTTILQIIQILFYFCIWMSSPNFSVYLLCGKTEWTFNFVHQDFMHLLLVATLVVHFYELMYLLADNDIMLFSDMGSESIKSIEIG